MTEKVVEKKVASRTVAIALGIICIVLAVGLVGAVVNYTSTINGKDSTIATKNSEISDLQNQISSKDSQISSLTTQISSRDSTISSLNTQNTNLQNQVTDLTNTLNLAKSTIWVDDKTISQPASSYTYWTPAFSASYAGYVSVNVQTSTTTNTYARVIYYYYAHGVNMTYDNQITVGTGGTAVFPILPSSSIDIRVGNTNLFNGATETVTITYYY